MVQVATTLPIFLLALPAGAVADIVDRRKFLIVGESFVTIVSAVYAEIVSLGLATPFNLVLFTFLIGAAGALTAPAWQSIVPELVAKEDLHPAIAADRLIESWLEHLRQQQRITNADRLLQDVVHRFHGEGKPLVSHFIACEFVAPAGRPDRVSRQWRPVDQRGVIWRRVYLLADRVGSPEHSAGA
jgi:hypothetical protein